ncbi:MAG: cobalt-zinc-cadmium efflux system outer membrane protein [Glaciecola sp.]|jgi:cobalt-zinc-cadmium efflux system outer membrane protein
MQLQKATWLLCLLAPACASSDTSYREPIEAWQESRAQRWDAAQQNPDNGSNGTLAADAQLPELLAYGRQHNPKLSVAFYRWQSAVEQIPQASKLPEPRVMFGAFLEEVETRTGPMQGKVSISQALPWFGKRSLAGDVATVRAQAMAEGVEIAFLEVDRQIKDVWYEYAWLQQAQRVAHAHQDLLGHWQKVARTRLELGLSQPSEILRVELELGQLDDRFLSLEDLERPLRAKLNAALNRPSDAVLAEPTYPLAAVEEVDVPTLLASLSETNPRLRQLKREVEAAQHGLTLAGKAGYPDFSLGVDYTFIGSNSAAGSGEDAVALTFGLSLPVWRGAYRAQREGARAQMHAARASLESTRHTLVAELEMALFKLRDASRQLVLLNTSLIPKGQEAVGTMGSTYQSGDASFIDVIDAQRLLLEFQLQAVRAEADRAQALAKVEEISGVSLSTSQNF